MYYTQNSWQFNTISISPGILVCDTTLRMECAGANADEHVLRAAGPVLHAGAGWPAALQRHGLHESADHRPLPRLQARQEEDGRHSQP
jgi:hypothetical protein